MADNQAYPTGNALMTQIAKRHRRGTIYRALFLSATIIAIVVLLALLYNIINQAFGLAAVQNEVEPESLVIAVEEAKLLSAANVVVSEDDAELATGIIGDPNAVGFFGYAYFSDKQDRLRAVAVDGVAPSAETVENGRYPFARPLYLYTSADILAAKPQVTAFLAYYLQNVGAEIEDVGYFPAGSDALSAAEQVVANALGGDLLPAINPAGFTGPVAIAGSSTVFPLTQRMAQRFAADGSSVAFTIDSTGSSAGLQAFCDDESIDIANASRPITPAERVACRANGREPVEIRVGTDALAVVVSQQNTFADNLTREQLVELFVSAETWSDINASWPAAPVARYIPGADSGTLDFFAEAAFAKSLDTLSKEELVEILVASVSRGRGRALERDQRFFAETLVFEDPTLWDQVCAEADPASGCTQAPRSQANVYQLVLGEVVKPQVEATWPLVDSLTQRDQIVAQAKIDYPDANVEFRSWITPRFLTTPQSSTPELAGVRTAILGTLWVILITFVFSFPIGVGAAIYLEEYASQENRINRLIQTNINNLAGVPSIIYGMLGLAVFVRILEPITSGAAFGLLADETTANGRTILAAGLTLGLLILPIIIINAQEAIRAVPSSLRQASFGLGATHWQTIWHHVLPNALPGILTGVILAIARAVGETAPLVVIGASTFITSDPNGPFSKFTVLPIQIYQWTSRPQDEFRNIAAAAIIVLLILMLTLNASAVILRNRFMTTSR